MQGKCPTLCIITSYNFVSIVILLYISMVLLYNILLLSLKVGYVKPSILFCSCLLLPSIIPSLQLATLGWKKPGSPDMVSSLKWFWDKRWLNGDSRDFLCKSALLFKNMSTSSNHLYIGNIEDLNLQSIRNHLRMMLQTDMKPEGEFSDKGPALLRVWIKDHTSLFG